MTVPDVDPIDRLPPVAALPQHRGTPTTRSPVGSMITLSNQLLWMLYSRALTYPRRARMLAADSCAANTVDGCGRNNRTSVVSTTSLRHCCCLLLHSAFARAPSRRDDRRGSNRTVATFASHQSVISMPCGSHCLERIDGGCFSRKRGPACPCTPATMRPS